MKKINQSKTPILLAGLYLSTASLASTLELDQDLVTGNEPVIPTLVLSGDTQYQLGTTKLVSTKSAHPVICNRVENYEPVAGIQFRVLDPNGDNKGDTDTSDSLMGIQSDVNFNVKNKSFEITTENRSKSICLTSEEYDYIFNDLFEEVVVTGFSNITYDLIGVPVGGYVPGDDVRYDVTYVNSSGGLQQVDMIEYYPYTNNSPAYFNGQLVSLLSCDILDGNDLSVGSCSSENGVIKNIDLLAGYKIKLSVRRPISDNAVVGEVLQLMTAVFAKTNTIDSAGGTDRFVGTNTSFSGFDLTTINIPVVSVN